jgi:hypothetical protein
VLFVVVEVNVTFWPTIEGFKLDPTVVVVGSIPPTVVMSIDHPPPIADAPPPRASSTTYKFQVPLGFRPLKDELNVAEPVGAARLYGAAGAGAGNVSTSTPKTILVGLYEPVVITGAHGAGRAESGNCVAAESSSVMLTLVRAHNPPVSAMITNFTPLGDTSKKSRSLGRTVVNPVIVTLTSDIVPDIPETVIADGYRLPTPGTPPLKSATVKELGFENTVSIAGSPLEAVLGTDAENGFKPPYVRIVLSNASDIAGS